MHHLLAKMLESYLKRFLKRDRIELGAQIVATLLKNYQFHHYFAKSIL